MIDYKQDGIDHINIFSRSRSSLGRFLSNFTQADIETEDGEFSSVEGYWYWLLHNDDTVSSVKERELLRTVSGIDAKNLGKSLIKRFGTKFYEDKNVDADVNFQRKIKAAIKFKIDNNPKYKNELAKCILPFEHYYVFFGKVIKPENHKWVINYIDQLRKEYGTSNGSMPTLQTR